MKKLIPLEVSSSLSAISADRPLEVTPYANATGVTTEKAPILMSVRSESSVDAEQFAERMRAVGGQGTSAQARLALNAVAAVLGELVGEYGAEAGDTVKVKWTQGGVAKEATIDPAYVTANMMPFEFPDALIGVPTDTELTFEITFGETVRTKGTTLVEE